MNQTLLLLQPTKKVYKYLIQKHSNMKINYFLILSMALLLFTVGCEKDDDPDLPEPPEEGVSGQVSGTWTKGKTYNVTGHLEIPEGKSLTIEEGVKVVMTDSLLETEVIIR